MMIDIPPSDLIGSDKKQMNLLSCLAYPAGMGITAVINNEYQHRVLQPKAHEYRLLQIKEESKNRIEEIRESLKLQIDQQREIEKIRSHYGISTHKATREIDRKERENNEIDRNSPFVNPVNIYVNKLRGLFEDNRNPIVLFAPFKDDSKTIGQNIEGGHVNFLTTLNQEYKLTQYQHLTTKRDGYLNRPLLGGDCDVDSIYSVLGDLPVILVHGVIQGTHHSPQLVQRIHPQITFWNLFPHQENIIDLSLSFFDFESILINSPTAAIEMGKYSLGLQANVGRYLVNSVGLLATIYHLYHFGTTPNIKQFELESNISQLFTLQMGIFYDMICKEKPEKACKYRLEQSIILGESGLKKEAAICLDAIDWDNLEQIFDCVEDEDSMRDAQMYLKSIGDFSKYEMIDNLFQKWNQQRRERKITRDKDGRLTLYGLFY